jgi:hypothetical protein
MLLFVIPEGNLRFAFAVAWQAPTARHIPAQPEGLG